MFIITKKKAPKDYEKLVGAKLSKVMSCVDFGVIYIWRTTAARKV